VADRLIAEWPNLYGHERPPVMNALLSRPEWAAKLLDAIALGKVKRQDLGVAQVRHIRDFKDEALTRKLTEVWGALQEPDESTRREAMRRWQKKLSPDALRRANLIEGQKLFAASCGVCHQIYGAGSSIGPDLTGTGRQSLEYLLENILFPSAIVPADFRQTTLLLKDGRVLDGIVRSRSAQAVVLAMIGESVTISRGDIAQEQTSELSLMPEGLLDGLNDTQAIDLFGFLMSTAPPQTSGTKQ